MSAPRGSVRSVYRMTAREAIGAVADPNSLRTWDTPPERATGLGADYLAQLAAAAGATGSDEAVVTGEVRVGGQAAGVLAWEFGFLGGSVGVATARRLVTGIRRATAEGLPLLAMPRSGGTRMQEGTPAFMQMQAITAAVAEHRAAGLPYLVHLCNPTTGGVLATLGSVGDITTAEPGAMIGFLGPRAYQAITGREFPEGVQTAEHLRSVGIIDAVLPWSQLRERWATLLRLWADRPGQPRRSGLPAAGEVGLPLPGTPLPVTPLPGTPLPGTHPSGTSRQGGPVSPDQLWDHVLVTRLRDRVGAGELFEAHVTDALGLPGTAAGEVAEGVLVGVGRFDGVPVVLAATNDRRSGHPLTVGGLRTVRRGIALAGRWGLPVVTVVDTLGAQLSVEAERSGIAGEIARVLLDFVEVRTPTVALLLGAGTGGAALAMMCADRVVASSRAWVCPLAPEGAAAIRQRRPSDAAQMAWDQRIGAHSLVEIGVVDRLVSESEPGWLSVAAREVGLALAEVLAGEDPGRRVERLQAWSG